MANAAFKDATGTTRYRRTTGSGTDDDPFVFADAVAEGAATSAKQDELAALLSADVAAFAFEAVAVSTSSVALTASAYAPDGQLPATYARGSVESAAVRVRVDGGAPTGGVGGGELVPEGITFEVFGAANIANARMIRASDAAQDAVVAFTYYR